MSSNDTKAAATPATTATTTTTTAKHPPRDMHQGVPAPPYAELSHEDLLIQEQKLMATTGANKERERDHSHHHRHANPNNFSSASHDNSSTDDAAAAAATAAAAAAAADDDADMIDDHLSFLRTVAAFHNYRNQAMSALHMRKRNFQKLQEQHRDLLCIDLESMLVKYEECIQMNSTFFEAICEASEELFENYWPDGTSVNASDVPAPTPLDMDKVFSTLRQFVRDWSAEGKPERDCVYKPVLDTLESCFPDRSRRDQVRILVPGAGLCRLSVELALRGFFAQANEFSYHMLIAGHYIQNHVYEAAQHTIFPYCDNTSNLVNRDDQFAEVHIPDLCAAEAIEDLRAQGLAFGELSMVAGDFTEVYKKPAQHKTWSAVATCFFIDTAHNIIEYLEIIFNLLEPGGVWVNIGPLLYHFADSADDMSIELSLGELLTVAQRIGFELVSNAPPSFVDTTYTNNQRSMKQLVYRCAFFVLRRPLVDKTEEEKQGGGGGEKSKVAE